MSSNNGDKARDPETTPVDPFELASRIKGRGPAPVHLWDPPFCGNIDMLIKRDGSWYHDGKPIRRPAMVRLFSTILKREANGDFFLVTPVEKVGIRVEDCPFVITEMEASGSGANQTLRFTTNTGEEVEADVEHRLSVTEDELSREPHPVIHVRDGLDGLLSRPVFYRLVELAEEQLGDEETVLGVWSGGEFFPLGQPA